MVSHLRSFAALTDGEIVERVLTGDTPLFEMIMRRHNQRLFRVAWSVLKKTDLAEDAVQEAYLQAFANLGQVREAQNIGAWLSTITLRTAYAVARKNPSPKEQHFEEAEDSASPQRLAEASQVRAQVELAIEDLPQAFRVVFVLREVEGLSTEETAMSLNVSTGTVKSRLFRAKAALRRRLQHELSSDMQVLEFAGWRCDRLVALVLRKLV